MLAPIPPMSIVTNKASQANKNKSKGLWTAESLWTIVRSGGDGCP